MVEQSAVNRPVVGSNPTVPANVKEALEEHEAFCANGGDCRLPLYCKICGAEIGTKHSLTSTK